MRRTHSGHAATTPPCSKVAQAMLPFCTDTPGNPWGVYSCGQVAKRAVAEVTARVGESIGARCEGFVSKSGGTEADDCALKGQTYGPQESSEHGLSV